MAAEKWSEGEELLPDQDNQTMIGTTPIINDDQPSDYRTYLQEQRKQKIALSAVAVLGLGIILLGYWQLRNTLTLPWPTVTKPGENVVTAKSAIEIMDVTAEDPNVLKQRDSDNDQINDFDEYYIYGTSVYLADSDSDGDSDFIEIQAGEDPNCAKGRQCFRSAELAAVGLGEMTVTNNSENDLLNISADTLRKLLLQSGKVNEAQLKIISDEDLLALYQQMLAENPDLVKKFEAQSSSAENSEPTTAGMTITEIKKILLDQGISEAEIDAFSDAELVQMYQEAMVKVKENNE